MTFYHTLFDSNDDPFEVQVDCYYEVWNGEIFLDSVKIDSPIPLTQNQQREIDEVAYTVCEQDFIDRRADFIESRLEEKRYGGI